MASVAALRTVKVSYVSEGADKFRSDAEAAASSQANLAQQSERAALVSEQAARRQLSATTAFEKLRATVDPTVRALQQYERGLSTLDRALAQDASLAADAADVQRLLQRRYDDAAAAANRLSVEQRALARDTIAAREAAVAQASAFQATINQRIGIRSAAAGGDRASDFAAAAEAADRLRSKYDGLFRSQETYTAALREVNQAERAGIITADLATAAREKATLAYNQAQYAMRDGARATAVRSQEALRVNLGFREAPNVADRAADFEAAAAAADRLRARYDPLFAAQRAYRADLIELRGALGAGVLSEDAYTAALTRRKSAFVDQIATLGRVSAAEREMAAASERSAAAARSAANASAGWQGLGMMGAASLAEVQIARARTDVNAEASRRLGGLGATANQNTAGRRLRSDEITNLMYQGGDVAAQLGSGSPLGMIAMQQGPQIAQIFAGPGGASVKGAFGQAGEAASGFLSKIGPVGIGLGGLTLAAGVGATALLSYRSAQTELERSIGGVGRASGVTVDSINRMTDAQARAAGMSRSTARETAAIYAGTGRVGPELLGSAVGVTRDVSKFLGVDQAEGATVLAGALGDVSRGATDLSQRYGLLNDATAESVRRLDAQGDRLGAQRRLLDAVRESTQGLAEQTTGWGRVSQGVSDIWGELGRVVDKAVTGGDLDTRLKTARDALAEARRDAEGSNVFYRQAVADPRIATFEADVRRLEKLAETRDGLIGRLQSAQRSAEIGSLVRVLQPELVELRTMQDRVELLRKAISDPIKFGLDRQQLADATTAFERLSRIAKTMAEDVDRFGSASVAALNRTADFNLRTATMNPVERSAAEVNRQFDDLIRERGLSPNGRTSAQVNADYDLRLGVTSDLFDRNRIMQERDRAVADARQLEGLLRNRDVELRALNARTEQSAIRSSAIPDSLVQAIIGAESGGRGTARNPTSSATGYGQFIDGTWERLFRDRFAERAAGMSSAEILSRRSDRVDSEALIAAYAQENARALERAQLPVNSTNLYLGHHFGEGGMLGLLRADRNALSRDVLGDRVANANPRTVGNLTVGDTIGTVSGMIARNEPGVKNLRDQTEVLRAQVGVTDQSVAATARLERVQELLNQERARGTDLGRSFATAQDLMKASAEKLTPEMEAQRRAILEASGAYGQAAAAVTDYRGRQTLMFERDQLGRSSLDASVYARTRSMYGETNSREARAFMGQARENAEMYETKAMLSDGVTSFVTDLRRGGDAATALSNAFGNAADRLIAKVMDSAISSAFGAIGGGSGGGGIGGFFSSLLGGGNATGVTLYSSPAGPGFASGGYTGVGGRLDPAGIVHRGEYVFDAASTKRIGVHVLEGMRRGVPGYDTGGSVGVPAWMPPPANAVGMGAAPAFNFIDQRPAGSPDIEPTARRRADGGFDVIVRGVEGRMGQRAASGQGPFKQAAGGAGFRNG
ncbi:phage tail length tape measure family protein [Methylorubrum populi]